MDCMQAFLVQLFEDVNFCAIHARRTTIMVQWHACMPNQSTTLQLFIMILQVKDMKLACRIRGGGQS